MKLFYPGYALPTFGLMFFDVTFDEEMVAQRCRYLKGFEHHIMTTTGQHKLEIVNRNILTKSGKNIQFFVEFPTPGLYKILLTYDKYFTSGWQDPIVVKVGGH